MSKWKLSHISAGLTAVTVGYRDEVGETRFVVVIHYPV